MTRKVAYLTWVFLLLFSCSKGQTAKVPEKLIWEDGFESYSEGILPSPWIRDGNADASVVTDNKFTGQKSVKLYGVVGGYWATLAYRYIGTDSVYYIDFAVCNGSEQIPSSGHQTRAVVGVGTEPDWTKPGNDLITWHKNGEVRSRGGILLGTYSTGKWYRVRIIYRRNPTNVNIEYYINGVLKRKEVVSSHPEEMNFKYICITAQAGTVWYDEVKIWSPLPKSTTFAQYMQYIAGMDFSPLPDGPPKIYGSIIDWDTYGCDENPYYKNSIRLLEEGAFVKITFQVNQSYKRIVLAVTHLSSYCEDLPGGGSSPITIKINNYTVTSNFDPAEYHEYEHCYFTDLWDVTPYIKEGINTISFIANDLTTHYWLQRFVIAGIPSK